MLVLEFLDLADKAEQPQHRVEGFSWVQAHDGNGLRYFLFGGAATSPVVAAAWFRVA